MSAPVRKLSAPLWADDPRAGGWESPDRKVIFFRIGMMFWFATTGGAGIDTQTFTGPFIYTWYFGQMALPLLLLEFYFWASEPERGAAWKLGAALIVVAATIAMSIGIFAAVVGMWLPRIV